MAARPSTCTFTTRISSPDRGHSTQGLLGRVVDKDVVQYLATSYIYESGGPAITAASGAVNQKGRPFCHGFEIYLEDATLLYDSDGGVCACSTRRANSKLPKIKGSGDPLASFQAELHLATEAVASARSRVI